MTLTHRIVIATLKGLTSLLCRIDDEQLVKVPQRGPLILVANHVNILEIPILYTRLQPRPVIGFAAAYRWEALWTRWLLDVCRAIPLHRGEADIAALRKALELLKAGYIFAIAPEGTRSGAPLLPVVYYGAENYRDNLRRLRRTDFHIVVGEPFSVDAGGVKVTRQVRRQIVDEIMYQMAALLPPAYRGVYSDLNAATEKYLTFQ
jgi:1-acyl-sn-glycerol-3-phosphate acyltransferase